MSSVLAIATAFGRALDRDDYAAAHALLAEECTYDIGSAVMEGPTAICASYETNMQEGRNKLDDLVWGTATAELVSDHQADVFFTDYLTHRGESHTHRCKQRVTVNAAGKITHIQHHNLPGEPEKLKAFYQKVGLA
ncbi:MAG: nuclear transport factor 2 family protein [Bacteroidota bacterium]